MATKTCADCGKKIEDGHITYVEYEIIYFCSNCFKLLYTEEEQKKMYENKEQYYTEFED